MAGMNDPKIGSGSSWESLPNPPLLRFVVRTEVLTTNLRKIGTGLATFTAGGYWVIGS